LPARAAEQRRDCVVASYQTTRRVAFEPELLFSIVADVARYEEFLPLCTGSKVWDERTDEQGRRCFRASLDIEYPKLRLKETFVSDVIVDEKRLTVRARSNEGPVKHIDNRWLFTQARGGCDIDFHLEYEMASRMLQMAMGGVFDMAVRKIMTAFEERARTFAAQGSA
jgi:coenzyme Q-binding protein COQ10